MATQISHKSCRILTQFMEDLAQKYNMGITSPILYRYMSHRNILSNQHKNHIPRVGYFKERITIREIIHKVCGNNSLCEQPLNNEKFEPPITQKQDDLQ